MTSLIKTDRENILFNFRDLNVMIDIDLAEMFGVSVNELIRAVRKHRSRFPEDFMFEINADEKKLLSKHIRRFNSLKTSRRLPFAFTDSGVSMLSVVLESEKAIQVSIGIVRTFAHYRYMMTEQEEEKTDIQQLDEKLNQAFQFLLQKIDSLNQSNEAQLQPIGFKFEE